MKSRDQWRQFFDMPIVEWSMFAAGVLLIIAGLLIAPLPGPGGIFLIAPGAALILKTSMWAKRHYVRIKRWQPKAGRWMDWALRRPSAQRREAIRKGQESRRQELTCRALSTIGALDSGCLLGGPFSLDFEAMSDEAHLSAEQPGPQTAPRVPLPHGDGRRPQGAERPPRPRPQEAQRLTILKKRADFLAANSGKRASTPGFVLLVRDREDADPAMRVGFTVTKKIGGAVVRNRMKRRFRALAREIVPAKGLAGADHVMIGRSNGIERDYALLRSELGDALDKLRR